MVGLKQVKVLLSVYDRNSKSEEPEVMSGEWDLGWTGGEKSVKTHCSWEES